MDAFIQSALQRSECISEPGGDDKVNAVAGSQNTLMPRIKTHLDELDDPILSHESCIQMYAEIKAASDKQVLFRSTKSSKQV